jgi:hypothetical protein
MIKYSAMRLVTSATTANGQCPSAVHEDISSYFVCCSHEVPTSLLRANIPLDVNILQSTY